MKARVRALLALAMVLSALLGACGKKATPAPAAVEPPAKQAKIVVATDAAFPPMEFVDENKEIVGFDIDMMDAIAVAMGLSVEYKNTAWDGIFAGLEGGDYDAILSAVTIRPDRQEKYDFSDPYINAGQIVVVLMAETEIESYEDLPGKVVGAQIGTTGAFAVQDIEGTTLKEYDNIDLAFLDLLNGNVQAVVVDTPVAADYALTSDQFRGKLKIVGEPFTDEYYGLVVRKGESADLLAAFSEGLKKIQGDGTYDAIYAKWISGGEMTAPVAAAYTCTDEWGCAQFKQGQAVKVAYVGPMTADYSAFGTDIARGAELALVANPDVLGWKIELLVEDTQGQEEQGAAVANKLAADPQVVAVDGHTFSGSTEVAMPIYEDAGIVMVSPSATTPSLTKLGSAVFNRVAFHDELQGRYAADYIYNVLGIRRIAIMHDGGAYGQPLAEMTGAFFEELGGTLVGGEGITPGETDYSAPLAAIAALDPELIYFGGYSAEGAVLVTQMAAAGLTDALFFGCDGTYGADYLDLAGSAAEGSFATYVPIPESAAFAKFKADYEAAYGDPQGKLSPFSPHGYDAMSLILAGLDKVAVKSGDTLYIPRKALADTVRATADFQGLTGMITCSDTGECAAASVLFMEVVDGEWVPGPGQ